MGQRTRLYSLGQARFTQRSIGAKTVFEPKARSSREPGGRFHPRSMEHVRDNLARFQLEANGG